jgi:hypothetical protein
MAAPAPPWELRRLDIRGFVYKVYFVLSAGLRAAEVHGKVS